MFEDCKHDLTDKTILARTPDIKTMHKAQRTQGTKAPEVGNTQIEMIPLVSPGVLAHSSS